MRITLRTNPMEVDIPGHGESLPVEAAMAKDQTLVLKLTDGRGVIIFGDSVVFSPQPAPVPVLVTSDASAA